MTPRIQKAIDIFLDAINQGTLAKGDCTKCAVGNLVRVGCGYDKYEETSLKLTPNLKYINWSLIFCTGSGGHRFKRKTYPKIFKQYPEVKRQFDSVDFTIEELAAIERTFENNTRLLYRMYIYHSKEEIRKDQINGLKAVIELMLSFDEQKDDVSEVFTKRADLIPV